MHTKIISSILKWPRLFVIAEGSDVSWGKSMGVVDVSGQPPLPKAGIPMKVAAARFRAFALMEVGIGFSSSSADEEESRRRNPHGTGSSLLLLAGESS